MFLPIGDSPNFKDTPWLTWSLIGLNVLVFLFLYPLSFRAADPNDPAARAYVQVIEAERGVRVGAVSAYDAVVFRFGFKPRFPTLLTLMTSMFLHGGWMHLIGNMLFLWIYGDNVEHRLGRLGFLLAYLGTGMAATAGDAMLRSASYIPSVGASGAISGVLGFYFIWFPRNRVRVFIFLFPIFMNVVELPARLVLGIYLVIDNLLPALLTGGQGGVAYGAHIGGFLAGTGVALLLDSLRLRRPETEVRAQRRVAGAAAGVGDQLREALAGDDLNTAYSLVAGASSQVFRAQLDGRDLIVLGDRLAMAGHPRAALGVYQRTLSEHPSVPTRAQAHVGAARILWKQLGMPAEAYQHLVRAIDSQPTPETMAEARQLLAEMAAVGTIPRRWITGA
jgi:membrane associated rhomboid family serine protease